VSAPGSGPGSAGGEGPGDLSRDDLVREFGEPGVANPNVVDLIKSGKLDLLINTPLGRASRFDEKAIRRAAVQGGVTCITTLSAAAAAVNGIREQREKGIQIKSLQELHKV